MSKAEGGEQNVWTSTGQAYFYVLLNSNQPSRSICLMPAAVTCWRQWPCQGSTAACAAHESSHTCNQPAPARPRRRKRSMLRVDDGGAKYSTIGTSLLQLFPIHSDQLQNRSWDCRRMLLASYGSQTMQLGFAPRQALRPPLDTIGCGPHLSEVDTNVRHFQLAVVNYSSIHCYKAMMQMTRPCLLSFSRWTQIGLVAGHNVKCDESPVTAESSQKNDV
jgi:hypothetical protein